MTGRRAFGRIRGCLAYFGGMGQDPRGRADPPRGRADPPRRDGGPPRSARARPARISPATYWRRRVSVLAVGIGLLTTLGWAVNGMLGARPAADRAGSAGGTGAAGTAVAQVSRSRALPASSSSPRPGPVPSRHRSTARSPAAGKAPACAAGAVTLRLSSPQYWYQAGKMPSFTVHAVSTGGRPCRFNVGARFVSVVVASDRRIWGSADCVSGSGSRVVVLAQGVPAVLHVSWDRRTSSPGCGGTSHPVAAGEYQVTAVAGHLRSETVNLVLGAQGASGP